MRKFLLAGVAAFGFLAIVMTAMLPGMNGQGDSEGIAANFGGAGHTLVMLADFAPNRAPTCTDVGTC